MSSTSPTSRRCASPPSARCSPLTSSPRGHSVILEGKPGRGKTHLAIAIAYRALQNGFDALFTTAAELIDELSAASSDGKLRDALTRYVKPHVLVVDEVGYLPYADDAASVLYHVVNDRHIHHRAMVFTTNKHPKRWGDVLHDDDLAEAIVDRVLERGRLLRLDGPSIRTKHLSADEIGAEEYTQEPARVSGKDRPEFPERTPAGPRVFAGLSAGDDGVGCRASAASVSRGFGD
jgi:DNA replication protein DnaC